MESVVFGAVVAVAVIAVSVLVAVARRYFSRHARIVREMLEVPRGRFPDAEPGRTLRFTGRIERAESVDDAPLSGRACVGWTLVVKEAHGRGKRTEWRTVVDQTEGVPFLLRDGDLVARVELGADADLAIVLDAHTRSGFLDDPSEREQAIVARFGVDASTWVGTNRGVQYREGVLEPGEEVAVVGTLRREVDPDPRNTTGYRGRAERFVVVAPPGGSILVSDDPAARK